MPYKSVWVEPEIFLEYKGVKVYHTYEDDDIDCDPMKYHFTLHGTHDRDFFDVRRLDGAPSMEPDIPYLTMSDPRFVRATKEERAEFRKAWDAWHDTGFDAVRRAAMRHAIDIGDLK